MTLVIHSGAVGFRLFGTEADLLAAGSFDGVDRFAINFAQDDRLFGISRG